MAWSSSAAARGRRPSPRGAGAGPPGIALRAHLSLGVGALRGRLGLGAGLRRLGQRPQRAGSQALLDVPDRRAP